MCRTVNDAPSQADSMMCYITCFFWHRSHYNHGCLRPSGCDFMPRTMIPFTYSSESPILNLRKGCVALLLLFTEHRKSCSYHNSSFVKSKNYMRLFKVLSSNSSLARQAHLQPVLATTMPSILKKRDANHLDPCVRKPLPTN